MGKIKDIPDEFFIQWANIKNGDMILKNTVMEAEEVFLKEYIVNGIEANG